MAELQYWVWLSERHGVRPKHRLQLAEQMGDARRVYYSDEAAYRAALPALTDGELRSLLDKDIDGAQRALARCRETDVRLLTIQDAAYPERLRDTYDPPVVLYLRGTLPALDERVSAAVLGTRKATPYGLRMAHRLGFELAKCGAIVVSGLTAGIDAEGARGALRAGGAVIGVLGGPIDLDTGGRLTRDTAQCGAVVSEFAPGSGIGKIGYRMRNRIAAGLSLAAVIVEAPEKSGALLFAETADSLGRELFAVPGNADAKCSAGTNALLKDGVRPATCAWDVLADYAALYPDSIRHDRTEPPERDPEPAPQQDAAPMRSRPARLKHDLPPLTDPPETGEGFVYVREPIRQKVIDKPAAGAYIDLQRQLENLSETQLKIVTALTEPHTHVDDLVARLALPAPTVLAELTMLQIRGYVTQEPGKRFSLNIKPDKT